MNEQNPYNQGTPQDPYANNSQGEGQNQQVPPQTVYGSYGEQQIIQPDAYSSEPYQQPAQQSYERQYNQQYNQPYQQPYQQPYPPVQTPGYGQQQAPFYAAPVIGVPERGAGFALAGFIIGIISIFTSWFPFFGIILPIVGVVLSILGRQSASRRALAIIGLVLSVIALVISLIVIIVIIVAAAHDSSTGNVARHFV